MLSRTAEYALRAVLYLADNAGDAPITVDGIAESLGVPRNYLSKTLHLLARQGVLSSSRGPRGGFVLAVPADRLTLYEVVEPFQELGERRTCLLGRPVCSDRDPCPAHHRWKEVAERLADFFRETTVAELIQGARVEGAPDRV